MFGVVRAEDCKVGFFDIFNAGTYKFGGVEGPPIQVSRGGGTPGYGHDIVLVVHIVVLELDGVWVDYFFLINDDFLAILIMIGEA